MKNTDIDGYSKTLTDHWIEHDPNGTNTTKAQAIGAIKQQIAMMGLTVTDCAATRWIGNECVLAVTGAVGEPTLQLSMRPLFS